MTYARRYNIQALLDLSTDDDDGNLANSAPATKVQQYPQDDREGFNERNLEAMKKELEAGEVFSKSAIKTDYKLSKDMQAKLAALATEYPNQFTA
jgi:hypothetical protein